MLLEHATHACYILQVREAGGEVVAVVEGDSLRVRVRGPSRSSSGSGGWGDAGAGSWGSGGGHAGPVGLGKGGAEDDAVVRLEVGTAARPCVLATSHGTSHGTSDHHRRQHIGSMDEKRYALRLFQLPRRLCTGKCGDPTGVE